MLVVRSRPMTAARADASTASAPVRRLGPLAEDHLLIAAASTYSATAECWAGSADIASTSAGPGPLQLAGRYFALPGRYQDRQHWAQSRSAPRLERGRR